MKPLHVCAIMVGITDALLLLPSSIQLETHSILSFLLPLLPIDTRILLHLVVSVARRDDYAFWIRYEQIVCYLSKHHFMSISSWLL